MRWMPAAAIALGSALLAATAASIGLAAARRRAAAWPACAALATSIAWLFLEVRVDEAGPQDAAGWTAYPPLVLVSPGALENSWRTWIALAAGTVLVAASALLPRREETAPGAPPLP